MNGKSKTKAKRTRIWDHTIVIHNKNLNSKKFKNVIYIKIGKNNIKYFKKIQKYKKNIILAMQNLFLFFIVIIITERIHVQSC